MQPVNTTKKPKNVTLHVRLTAQMVDVFGHITLWEVHNAAAPMKLIGMTHRASNVKNHVHSHAPMDDVFGLSISLVSPSVTVMTKIRIIESLVVDVNLLVHSNVRITVVSGHITSWVSQTVNAMKIIPAITTNQTCARLHLSVHSTVQMKDAFGHTILLVDRNAAAIIQTKSIIDQQKRAVRKISQ